MTGETLGGWERLGEGGETWGEGERRGSSHSWCMQGLADS